MQKLLFYIFSFLFICTARADTTVYFFEYRMPNGQVYSFDKGGRFYHAALKYHDQILEAHPYYGVHLARDLSEVGHLVAILHSMTSVTDLDQRVLAQLGKAFKLYSAWDDPNTTQCSKLVGQIIGVSPVTVQGGNLSLSPDLLYAELKKIGYEDVPISLASDSK